MFGSKVKLKYKDLRSKAKSRSNIKKVLKVKVRYLESRSKVKSRTNIKSKGQKEMPNIKVKSQ